MGADAHKTRASITALFGGKSGVTFLVRSDWVDRIEADVRSWRHLVTDRSRWVCRRRKLCSAGESPSFRRRYTRLRRGTVDAAGLKTGGYVRWPGRLKAAPPNDGGGAEAPPYKAGSPKPSSTRP